MNIVDVVIIFLILSCGVWGFKNGFFKQVVQTIGMILVFVISYMLKDYVANFISYNVPFIKFSGSFEGLFSLNIILHQLVAFLIIFVLLLSVFIVLVKITGIFEKILKFTIVLSIPSKILGFIVGLIQGYVIVFTLLFFINQPAIDLEIVSESKFTPVILNSSVGLSNIVGDMNNAVKETHELLLEYQVNNDKNKFNLDVINILLKNKIITVEYVEKLMDQGKFYVTGIEGILNNYR